MDVACIGIFVADIMGKPIDRVPDINRLILFDTLEMHTGGCAANTGRDLAKLGLSVGLGGKVGKDLFGRFLLEELSGSGLDTCGIVEDPSVTTSMTFAMISSDGGRRFITHLGANNHYGEKDVDLSMFSGARILHVAGLYLMESMEGEPLGNVMAEAKKAGFTTSIDTAYQPKPDCFDLLRPALPHLDIFIPSIEEGEMITGKTDVREMVHFFDPFDIPIVGIKMGEKGCYLKQAKQEIFVPSFEISAVDVSGAGDAFYAGFLYAYLQGWDLETMGKFGNAVAACAIGAIGCTSGVTSVQAAMNIMNNSPVKKVTLE